ncbi:hypothetical protein [Metabacillus bambusae]|uniref:Uncharacterized protein n=1 Tax=Metabacillus bambusae TaxID=2795218 RepID=A0ABS3N0E1_9BACI|nr:hypothetical protein [Metabacillus bambusae]MBO1511741.1 hypothetical protein [Metabacillus bambusae]
MSTQLLELKLSLKDLLHNLISRISPICDDLEEGADAERLKYWLEDLSVLTETVMVLTEKNLMDIDLDLFNEKAEMLLDKVEEKDYLFVSDLLQFELKPLFTYWDECITND